MSGIRHQRFFYCPKCSGKLVYKAHGERERQACVSCSYILYENPVVGVAGILFDDRNRLLLGRRKGGTYSGMWCIPCGYLEYDEDIYGGLCREFREETGLDVTATELFAALSNFHDPETHTVGIWFRVKVIGGTLNAGDDLDDVAFFEIDSIPPLAFPTDGEVIEMLRRGLGS